MMGFLRCGVVIVCTLFTGYLTGQTEIPTYRLQGKLKTNVVFDDSLYTFAQPGDAIQQLQPLMTGGEVLSNDGKWSAIRLINESPLTQRATLRFCTYADAARLLVVQDETLIDQQYSSYTMDNLDERLPSAYEYLWVNIEPGKEQTLYFQVDYIENTPPEHFSHLTLLPQIPKVNDLINQLTWQAFYSGLLVLLAVLGGLMAWVFRERVFLFYTGIMLSATLYFADRYGLLVLLAQFPKLTDSLPMIIFALSGIVVFAGLFVTDFLQMRQQMPRYYKVYAWFSGWTAVSPYLLILVLNDFQVARVVTDMCLGLWALLSIFPVARLARKGQSTARTLMWPFVILFVGGMLFLLDNSNILSGVFGLRYSFQVGLLFFSGFLFFILFERVTTLRKKKEQFEELSALKTRFFTNLSHEFRTPLTLMMGPLQQLLEGNPEPRERQLMEIALRNANNQLYLVNELLELSRLEAGKMELRASQQDVVPLVYSLVFAFESLAEDREIHLSFKSEQPSVHLYYEAGKLEKVVNNLLSNALKFTPSGGSVSVALSQLGQELCLSVSDTGPGIPQSLQDKVFERFFQVSASPEVGTGVGLALSRELVRLHHGRIEVESFEGEGATFRVFLPLGSGHLRPEERVESPMQSGTVLAAPLQTTEEIPYQKVHASTQPDATVLLIEDNDEVRAFIRQRLDTAFKIIEARDGQSGIEIAREHMPDLIVSDVMMPRKNGYEVCAALKGDVRTSHIPVILLTAKAEQEEKLQGLRTGADDYLAKPFDAEELRVRIHNLIQLREQLRQRFASAVELKPEEVSVNSIDQDFLERALEIVESHLGDEQFSVESLARQVGMSSPHLNRKLRALVNQSSNQFIRSIRLQRSADLLRQQSGTVAEIAFQTGFSSTAYFIKCFKDKYGETPGQFAKKQSES
ncbi:MAG: ATP-binding protein [Phaeodactylibacter sp.]|uniref:ATP-binding protein n=1 Tax=Phaeodactylibacter sp. TaxID=1940289 RepID=UPI0032EB825B